MIGNDLALSFSNYEINAEDGNIIEGKAHF